MEPDDLRPVHPLGTPWTVGRVVADTCVWIALQELQNAEKPSVERLLASKIRPAPDPTVRASA